MTTTIEPPASVVLPADEHAPSVARDFLRRVQCPSAPDRLESALLLVSELVTNAVRHGTPPLLLAVECDVEHGLQVRVSDGSAAVPVPREAGFLDESGRGMALVDVISDAWGVDPRSDLDGTGKTVWFLLH